MSFHVYVSRPGFKESPISAEEWLGVARKNSRLSVEERQNRLGVKRYEVSLAQGGERISLSAYGLIHAQNPSENLVEVMFELASALEAGVYSERLIRYKSVADWRRRSQKYRNATENRLQKATRTKRLRLLLWVTLILLSALLGWYLAPQNAA
jgi:hypothetical protein